MYVWSQAKKRYAELCEFSAGDLVWSMQSFMVFVE